MRIYYELLDEISETCANKCPFRNIGIRGENAPDCMVGSVTCQECKFCYGTHEGGAVFIPTATGDRRERMMFNRYVKCMFLYENTFKYQVIQFFYRLKRNLLSWIRQKISRD